MIPSAMLTGRAFNCAAALLQLAANQKLRGQRPTRRQGIAQFEQPLYRTVMLVWIPPGYYLDPVREDWSNQRQDTRKRGKYDFNQEPAAKTLLQLILRGFKF
jgi:hypothetical protein